MDEGGYDPIELLEQIDMNELIDEWLSTITYLEREVLVRRFGLLGFPKETLEEVGQIVNLTRERVRQIQIRGVNSLRNFLKDRGIIER